MYIFSWKVDKCKKYMCAIICEISVKGYRAYALCSWIPSNFLKKKKNDMYRKGSKDQIKWTEFMTIPPGLSKQSKKELANDTHSLGPSGNKLSQNTSSNYMHNLGSITM